jgi:hypothetical protein
MTRFEALRRDVFVIKSSLIFWCKK